MDTNKSKTVEIVDCNFFNRVYWLSDSLNNFGQSFYWTHIKNGKECIKTFNNYRTYKTLTLSKCTNSAYERKLFNILT